MLAHTLLPPVRRALEPEAWELVPASLRAEGGSVRSLRRFIIIISRHVRSSDPPPTGQASCPSRWLGTSSCSQPCGWREEVEHLGGMIGKESET